jgi:capsular exopolysaccharide synthesis family protein
MVRVESERQSTLARIDDEINRQVQAKFDALALAKAKEDSLAHEVDLAKDESLDVEQRLIKFNTMVSESETAEKFYASLDQRFNEADLTSLFQKDNIHVVDGARLPGAPIRPRVPMSLALSLAAGLLAGVGSAFFLEYLDRSVKGPEDVEHATGAPFLGVIPVAGEELEALHHPRSHVAEACRAVRTNILFAKPDDPSRTMLVTSAAPGEGKSTTVANLGIVFASGGARTLLVDTDLRRPRLHQMFGLSNDRGLTNLIVGDGKISDLVLPTAAPGLFLLPTGPIPPNPAELLGSASFAGVVKQLAAAYDRVIFDSPPVIAVTDPAVLSSVVDSVVLIARAGGTGRDLLAAARRRLGDVRAPLIGVILNALDVDANRSAYPYYYAQYYGSNGNGNGKGHKGRATPAAAENPPSDVASTGTRD